MDDHDLRNLEDELRRNRPEPRPELLSELVSRVEADAPAEPARTRRSRPRLRLGFAVAFASLFVVAFSAMGALGYAGSSTKNAVNGTVGAVKSIVKSDRGSSTSSSGGKQQKSEGGASKAAAVSAISAGTGISRSQAATAFLRGNGASFGGPGSLPSHFQYPRFVVVCVDFGLRRPFTIVLPRFLVPLFQPFIVHFGPCTAGDFGNGPGGGDDDD
jgi:hypothetical protein